MSHFFDAACLVRFDYNEGAHIVKCFPPDFDFAGQESILSICSFPEICPIKSTQNVEASIQIFASSLTTQNTFNLLFLYYNNQIHKNEPNSIVVITHKTIASEVFRIILDARILLLRLLKEEKQKFKLAKNEGDQSQTYDSMPLPEIILNEVWKGIQSCTFDYKTGDFLVCTPIRRYNILLNQKHVTYSQFDPLFWLGPHTSLFTIWRALLTGREILIVGDSATHVSCAIFSILSLIAPLKYSELYIAFTRLGDPRAEEIINQKSKKWKLVGTTNQFIAKQSTQFSVVGYLPPLPGNKLHEIDPDEIENRLYNARSQTSNHQSFSSSTEISSQFSLSSKNISAGEKVSSDSGNAQSLSYLNLYTDIKAAKTLHKATKQILKHFESKLNEKLASDPYFDVLERQLNEDDFYGVFLASKSHSNSAKSNLSNLLNRERGTSKTDNLKDELNKKKKDPEIKYFTTRDAMKFQTTATYRNWRTRILYRPEFRECFLSHNPDDVIKKLTVNELSKVHEVLINEISKQFGNDMHMCAVIKRHLHAIKLLLK